MGSDIAGQNIVVIIRRHCVQFGDEGSLTQCVIPYIDNTIYPYSIARSERGDMYDINQSINQ